MDVNIINVLLIVAAIAFSVYRQMRPRPVGGKNAYLPLLFVAYAVYSAFLSAHPTGILDPKHVAASLVLLLLGLVLEVGIGALRGFTMATWRDHDGTAWRKGTLATLGLWVAMIAVRIGFGVVGGYLFHTTEPTAAILLGVGATLIAQNAVVGMRAARLTPAAGATVA